MSVLIWFLTFILVLDCVVLTFLVLLQLPKKEAGAGVAFGGAATDALFGAGSGNVLTRITKYAAVIFFGLALLLTLLGKHARSNTGTLMEELGKKGAPAATAPATPQNQQNGGLLTPAPTKPATPPAAPATPAPASPKQ